ncbi:hypothetical protein [Parvularcula lutaonensis]|uniref:Uncharacterized protein n=1 Tax=Parvularcula lutaonensis TaxID=491923 RepID=A0ABV7MAD4_9PROT|nr:hypothetical protein [Parvularcula lutaonensis]GGY44594.1 hypothetical protein GCM10007148_11880 [Parvularcula lutaonensis]
MTEVLVAQYLFPSPSSGKTTHLTPAGVETDFDELKIVKYGPREYNLLYFRRGEEITDTGHGSLDEALEQANFEFGITKENWKFAN